MSDSPTNYVPTSAHTYFWIKYGDESLISRETTTVPVLIHLFREKLVTRVISNGRLKHPVVPKMVNVPGISSELQCLQRQRAIILKSRNMQANRLQAVVAGTIGYSSGMPEKERAAKFVESTKLIESVAEGTVEHPLELVIKATLSGITAFNELKDGLEKEMLKLVKTLPVAKWVEQQNQRGFGLLFLAIVVGETGDLSNYSNPSKLWRRLGCSPWTFGGKTLMGATWRSGKEGKLPAAEWEAFGYSPRRRSISYLIGEGIVKQNTLPGKVVKVVHKGEEWEEKAPGKPLEYRLRYDEFKERAAKEHPDWTPLRCHRHSMLVATKRLLRNLWRAWRDMK